MNSHKGKLMKKQKYKLSRKQERQLSFIKKAIDAFRLENPNKRVKIAAENKLIIAKILLSDVPVRTVSELLGLSVNTLYIFKKFGRNKQLMSPTKEKLVNFDQRSRPSSRLEVGFRELTLSGEPQVSAASQSCLEIHVQLPNGVKLFVPLQMMQALMPLLNGGNHAAQH